VKACKFEDKTGDGLTNDDTPIAGWTVYLTKNGIVQATAPTGADGCYTWTNLGPVPGGYYGVSEEVRDGWTPISETSYNFESPPKSGAAYSFTFVNKAAFVPNGTIVIVNDAVPNNAQDFTFNLNNNSTISQNFQLDDDSDPTLPNSQTFSVPPGTWSVSEFDIPATWRVTSLVCVDPTNNTTVDLSTATAAINLAPSETVTCTFTNAMYL